MTLEQAIKILQLTDEEVNELSMVKLSRKFAKLKRDCENDEEDELLTDAFDFLKVNYVSIKADLENKFKVDDSLFPTANLTIDNEYLIRHSMFLTVDSVPIEPATGVYNEEITVPIVPVKDIAHKDTVYYMWHNNVYRSEAIVKNITEEQYRKEMSK